MTPPIDNGMAHSASMLDSLQAPSSYIHTVDGPVVLHETHISWVLLAGHFAYKIKKPIRTDFLDYSTLSKRHHACCEELRLGSRYADGLYLDVVPITLEDGQICMDGDAQPIEFAVRMRRFDEDALLSNRLANNSVSTEDIVQLAVNIACFHGDSKQLDNNSVDDISLKIFDQAKQNFTLFSQEPLLNQDPEVQWLEQWTNTHFDTLREQFLSRASFGFVRECHGDLHCGNIVLWKGHFVPFDGIEFNSEYAWIDVMSDIAFLVMDLQELGHPELSIAFLNAYLEQTGDYSGLLVLRWYLVYRALVRAKVAVLRSRQLNQVPCLNSTQIASAKLYILLAKQLLQFEKRKLWITHGVSGSGKTTGSQQIIEREGFVRVRSDIERKRLFKSPKTQHPNTELEKGIYSPTASEATYKKLYDISHCILHSDFNVIVDATFLKHADRQRFRTLAETEGADFRILDFQVDESTLQQRITQRRLASTDASDATLEVLANQLRNQERLTPEELQLTVDRNR